MRVDVVDLRKAPGSSMPFEHEGPLVLDDVRFEGPARLRLRLSNADHRIMVRGKLQGQVRLVCDRCAEDFELSLEVPIEEEFIPRSHPDTSADGEFVWSAVNVFADDATSIDLTEALRQNVIAALPIQSLCSEACRGLCPSCGENLNRSTCACAAVEIDPRWAPLKALQAKLPPH